MNEHQLEDEGVARGMTPAQYIDAHEAFRRCSNQQRQICDWFERTGLLEAGRDSVVPSVLSVGSGSGDLDCELIGRLECRGGAFVYDAVDPNGVALGRFRDRCGELGSALANRVWLYEGCFESFEPRHTYDLIHVLHSIYGMEDVGGMMEKAYRMLSVGGMMGVICSTDDGINCFKREVFEVIDLPGRSGRVCEDVLVGTLSGLEGVSLSFEIIPSEIDVSECFDGTTEGELVMSFILQSEFGRLTPGEQVAALQVLDGHAVERAGRRVLSQPMMGATVRRRSSGGRSELTLNVASAGRLGQLSVAIPA